MPPSEPLIAWPQPFIELLGFIAIFLATGAVGFRWVVLGGSGVARSADPAERSLAARAEQRAALFGLIGAGVTLALFANKLPGFAARRHQTVLQFLSVPANALQIALLALVVLGLALGLARILNGWLRAVNPAHAFAGGLWIGTLFMLITCGLLLLKGSPLDPERRGTVGANMVHAFSPFALGSAALLGAMGMITAWTHLKRLSSLWTTPYGIALIIKLCLVAGVALLGAWNWKRNRPKLGTEAAAHHLRRAATAELAAASLVLIATAILVSLPSPR